MDLQIKTEKIGMYTPILDVMRDVKLSGDTVVSDYLPDVANVVDVGASMKILEKSIGTNAIVVRGEVCFTVLFEPEGSNVLKSVSYTLPFEEVFDTKGLSPQVLKTSAKIKSAEASAINSRKLSLSADVVLDLYAYANDEISLVSSISDPKGDIEVSTQEIGMFVAKELIEDGFELSEIISASRLSENIDCILKSVANVKKTDERVVNGKALLKGEVNLAVLYITNPEAFETSTGYYTIPFSKVIENPSISEGDFIQSEVLLNGYTLSPVEDLNGEKTQMELVAEILVYVTDYENVKSTVVSDAFSTKYDLNLSKKTYNINKLVDELSLGATLKESLGDESLCAQSALIGYSDAILDKVIIDGSQVVVSLDEVYNVLYPKKDDGGFGSISAVIPAEITGNMSQGGTHAVISPLLTVTDTNFSLGSGGEINTSTGVNFSGFLVSSESVELLAGANINEDTLGGKCVSKAVIYYVKEGDTLWKIAKRFGVKMSDIVPLSSKGSTDLLNIGDMLFIPIQRCY